MSAAFPTIWSGVLTRNYGLSVANSLLIALLFGVTVVAEYRFNPSLDVWLAISDTRILDRAMARSSGLRR